MPSPTLPPAEWVAAANMATRRGEPVTIRAVTVQAYQLQLADGTALAYRDAPTARAFRTPEQARATWDSFKIDATVKLDNA